ncbi:DUF3883 domain-containing protein [Marinobacter qingdaonensis]|uniref:DUF3427 domain-containing protein n=1 Tax=Marinobacter qingdaonensis TaxID=3108486 RepID=A0ABU5NY96_9GAMM|nr:DUF3427 domain-containing protein [Marinobacter sp. ASW11-75]MEA1080759.1 DUF3427 domain-containing protein [Marinobacter sp. ASW11-75]
MSIEFGKAGRINRLGSLLKNLSREEVLEAVSRFEKLGRKVDSFDESSRYDLIINGKAYPPKAVFGLAASAHLNFDVKSQHFVGGEASASFRILQRLGFEIKPKTYRPGRKEGLILHGNYSRRDAWKILGEGDTFRAGSGTWGLQGIIRDRPLPGDAVLFVTLGSYEGNQYEDAVTEDGALIWKSQAEQTQASPAVRQLVAHDETRNLVCLFLRTEESAPYTYFGPLSFREWDPASEKPVHIVWNILNWPLPEGLASKIGLALTPALSPTYQPIENDIPSSLTETAPPDRSKSKSGKGNGNAYGNTDWAEREARNRQLGLAGERLVIQKEIDHLVAEGREDLANSVEHTATVNSAAGYDIRSFDSQTGQEKYIEVKTTTGDLNTDFFISSNEISKAEEYGESYWIYRIYDFAAGRPARFYRVSGNVTKNFDLVPTAFRATRKF